MSCPAGNHSINALAGKSLSGRAATNRPRGSLKLSVVATSTSMRAGRSARAHTTPESTDTSPDWTPWLICGRSAARLIEGRGMPPAAVSALEAPAMARKRRRLGLWDGRRVIGMDALPEALIMRLLCLLGRDDETTTTRALCL